MHKDCCITEAMRLCSKIMAGHTLSTDFVPDKCTPQRKFILCS